MKYTDEDVRVMAKAIYLQHQTPDIKESWKLAKEFYEAGCESIDDVREKLSSVVSSERETEQLNQELERRLRSIIALSEEAYSAKKPRSLIEKITREARARDRDEDQWA